MYHVASYGVIVRSSHGHHLNFHDNGICGNCMIHIILVLGHRQYNVKPRGP